MIHTVSLNHITSLTKPDVSRSLLRKMDFIVVLFSGSSIVCVFVVVLTFICIKIWPFLCVSLCVGAAGASEKPIFEACQIPGLPFRGKCPSLLPPQWICCHHSFKVCFIYSEKIKTTLNFY